MNDPAIIADVVLKAGRQPFLCASGERVMPKIFYASKQPAGVQERLEAAVNFENLQHYKVVNEENTSEEFDISYFIYDIKRLLQNNMPDSDEELLPGAHAITRRLISQPLPGLRSLPLLISRMAGIAPTQIWRNPTTTARVAAATSRQTKRDPCRRVSSCRRTNARLGISCCCSTIR